MAKTSKNKRVITHRMNCANLQKSVEEHMWVPFHNGPRHFTPYSLRRKVINLTSFNKTRHELHRFFINSKPKPCGKSCHPKNPERVFSECFRYVAKSTANKIMLSTEGIDKKFSRPTTHKEIFPVFCSNSHSINRQITTNQIFFKRNNRIEVCLKAFMTRTNLAFSSCKGKLSTPFIKEYREVCSNLSKPLSDHLFGCSANNHKVNVLRVLLKKHVTYCATYYKNFH